MGVRSIKMPDVGEGVAEAEIVEWAVKVGDLVKEDQVVAAVMTDKATVDIPTPVAGSVLALGGAVGDVLAVGSELIRIDAPGLPDALLPAAPKSQPQQKPEPPPGAKPEPAPRVAAAEPATRPPEPQKAAPRLAETQTGAPRPLGEKPLAAPAVRLEGARGRRRSQIRARLRTCGTHHPPRPRRLYRPPAGAVEAIRPGAQQRCRDDQGRRHAPAHRREHGRVGAPHRAFLLCRGGRRHGARGTARRPQRRARRKSGQNSPCCRFSSLGSSRRSPSSRKSTLITMTKTTSSRASAPCTWASRRKRRTASWFRSSVTPRLSACTNARAKCAG